MHAPLLHTCDSNNSGGKRGSNALIFKFEGDEKWSKSEKHWVSWGSNHKEELH